MSPLTLMIFRHILCITGGIFVWVMHNEQHLSLNCPECLSCEEKSSPGVPVVHCTTEIETSNLSVYRGIMEKNAKYPWGSMKIPLQMGWVVRFFLGFFYFVSVS